MGVGVVRARSKRGGVSMGEIGLVSRVCSGHEPLTTRICQESPRQEKGHARGVTDSMSPVLRSTPDRLLVLFVCPNSVDYVRASGFSSRTLSYTYAGGGKMKETNSKNPMCCLVTHKLLYHEVYLGLRLDRSFCLFRYVFRLLGVHARQHQANLFHLQH